MSEAHASTATPDRREFLRCTACGLASLAALSLASCGGGDATTQPQVTKTDTTTVKKDTTRTGGTGDPQFEIIGNQVKVFLARVPQLASIPSFFLISQAQTIVLRVGENQYDAFTAICTHAGCLVDGFSGNKMTCPCHGSAFDLNGAVATGPAALPLARFAVTLDTGLMQLLVNKGS